MNYSACRINLLARQLGARRYLEIGVNLAETFRDVEIAERTGVDPHFQFDTNYMVNDFTRLVAKTSDNFFATEPFISTYDLVFIDGLHTFEQVVRDLSNTLLRTHCRSAIILDDTIPNDVYSAIPDVQATLRHREMVGSTERAWMGDVFKAVFYIHDFQPSLNYRTIIGSGNPQTLVWRANNLYRPPLFNNLEHISRLTYFDLLDHYDVLQTSPEEEAISLCIAETKALLRP